MLPVFRKTLSDQEKPLKNLCLRPSSLLAVCFLVVAAITLAYVGGVMSGRASGSSHRAQQAAAGHKAPDGTGEAAQADAVPQQQILAPEELRFARVLRGENLPPGMANGHKPMAGAVPTAQGQQENQKTAQQAASATPAAPASGGQSGQSGQTIQTGQAAQTGQTEQAVELHSLQPVGNLFDYVFQVGAFKDEDSVDSLRQRLEGRGMRTRMERSGKLLLVFVLLRGNDARANEVIHACESLNLGKPLLRSKAAVKQ